MEDEKHRKTSLYMDYELVDWRRTCKYKMCDAIADMLDETEKRTKIQVLTKSIEALRSQGYSTRGAMELLEIPEGEHEGYLERLRDKAEG